MGAPSAQGGADLLPAILGLVSFGVAAALLYWLATSEGRRRRAELGAWGAGRGLHAEDDEQQHAGLQAELARDFELFERGHEGSRKLGPLVTGTMQEARVRLFDYEYAGEPGEEGRRRQTVLCLESQVASFPSFRMRPEGVADKIRAHLGSQDIDFPDDPAFSKRQLLCGADEDRVRRLFTRNVRRFMGAREGLCVEGCAQRLLVYRSGRTEAAEGLDELADQAFAILRRLCAAPSPPDHP